MALIDNIISVWHLDGSGSTVTDELGTNTGTATGTNDTAHLEVTFNIVATLAITEAGMLNAATTGDLLNRQTFSAVNVVNGDTLIIKYDVAFS